MIEDDMSRQVRSPHIRLAEESDADAIAAIYRPIVESTAISFETVAPDRDEIAHRLAGTLPSHPWLVCEMGGRVAGYAYATRHRVRGAYQWSVDTSVYVDHAYRGAGVGRGLYQSLFGILAAQGFFNAFAGIALPNSASVGLHEAMGFALLGVYRRVGFKFGEWRDVGWWQLTLKAHEEPPAITVDLATMQRRSGWDELLARGESVIRVEAV
jgi:L-amino acid N-acyltransferase YncA